MTWLNGLLRMLRDASGSGAVAAQQKATANSVGVTHDSHPRMLQARPVFTAPPPCRPPPCLASQRERLACSAAHFRVVDGCCDSTRTPRRVRALGARAVPAVARDAAAYPDPNRRAARAQEFLNIPKGKEVKLVPSGYPGLAYLPYTETNLVITVGVKDPNAFPRHLFGCARPRRPAPSCCPAVTCACAPARCWHASNGGCSGLWACEPTRVGQREVPARARGDTADPPAQTPSRCTARPVSGMRLGKAHELGTWASASLRPASAQVWKLPGAGRTQLGGARGRRDGLLLGGRLPGRQLLTGRLASAAVPRRDRPVLRRRMAVVRQARPVLRGRVAGGQLTDIAVADLKPAHCCDFLRLVPARWVLLCEQRGA